MAQENDNKVPMPPKVNLHLPITFWTEVLMTLDKKIEVLSQQYGYGRVHLTVTIKQGVVQDVIFQDEIQVRGLVEKAKENESKEKKS